MTENIIISNVFVILLQVVMQVKMECGSELHRGDMKLPIRDVSVDGGYVSIVLGPLCFL